MTGPHHWDIIWQGHGSVVKGITKWMSLAPFMCKLRHWHTCMCIALWYSIVWLGPISIGALVVKGLTSCNTHKVCRGHSHEFRIVRQYWTVSTNVFEGSRTSSNLPEQRKCRVNTVCSGHSHECCRFTPAAQYSFWESWSTEPSLRI
jgi:hypothetical protein